MIFASKRLTGPSPSSPKVVYIDNGLFFSNRLLTCILENLHRLDWPVMELEQRAFLRLVSLVEMRF